MTVSTTQLTLGNDSGQLGTIYVVALDSSGKELPPPYNEAIIAGADRMAKIFERESIRTAVDFHAPSEELLKVLQDNDPVSRFFRDMQGLKLTVEVDPALTSEQLWEVEGNLNNLLHSDVMNLLLFAVRREKVRRRPAGEQEVTDPVLKVIGGNMPDDDSANRLPAEFARFAEDSKETLPVPSREELVSIVEAQIPTRMLEAASQLGMEQTAAVEDICDLGADAMGTLVGLSGDGADIIIPFGETTEDVDDDWEPGILSLGGD